VRKAGRLPRFPYPAVDERNGSPARTARHFCSPGPWACPDGASRFAGGRSDGMPAGAVRRTSGAGSGPAPALRDRAPVVHPDGTNGGGRTATAGRVGRTGSAERDRWAAGLPARRPADGTPASAPIASASPSRRSPRRAAAPRPASGVRTRNPGSARTSREGKADGARAFRCGRPGGGGDRPVGRTGGVDAALPCTVFPRRLPWRRDVLRSRHGGRAATAGAPSWDSGGRHTVRRRGTAPPLRASGDRTRRRGTEASAPGDHRRPGRTADPPDPAPPEPACAEALAPTGPGRAAGGKAGSGRAGPAGARAVPPRVRRAMPSATAVRRGNRKGFA
jgi:hypothetical protein